MAVGYPYAVAESIERHRLGATASTRGFVRLPYSLSRLRPASIALALVLLFALAGLFAVDRTIAASNSNRVRIESMQSAALVESFLAVHAEALQSMRGLYLDTSRSPDSAYSASP